MESRKHPIQHASFAPPAHAGVDGMPVAKMLWQAAPFATVLHHVQQGIEQSQIGHAYIAALPRQAVSDALKLTFSDLHADSLLASTAKVN